MTQQPSSPSAPGPATLQLPPPAPYDLSTPGEPAAYRVPAAYRRPYGELVRDKRGRGYNSAFMALMCAVAAYLTILFLTGGLAALACLPAVAGIILGIQALAQRSAVPRTIFHKRIGRMAWGGIIASALSLPLVLAVLVLNSWFIDLAERANCSAIYAGDDEAIARCIERNT